MFCRGGKGAFYENAAQRSWDDMDFEYPYRTFPAAAIFADISPKYEPKHLLYKTS